MYTILYIKYKTDKDLQYSTRNYTQYFAISSKGKESEKNRCVCVCVCVYVCLVAKSCPILYKPMDCSPPSSSVHGISQARILDQFAISISRALSPPRAWTLTSCIGRQILYCGTNQGSPEIHMDYYYIYYR